MQEKDSISGGMNEMAKTARMEIRADHRFLDALDDLSTRTGKSRANVIRDALNFYEKSLTEWEKGMYSKSRDNVS